MDSHGLMPLLCILRNNCTKAALSLLSKFSNHHSTRLNHASKLFMERWHCIFNTIVKESALKRHFIFHFCICLVRNIVADFDTICAFQSVKLFRRHPSLKANKIYLPFLLASTSSSEIYLNKSSLCSDT